MKRKLALPGLRAGKLVSMCYTGAPFEQTRVTCDFIHWLFHVDDLSDDMTDRTTARVAKDVMAILNGVASPDSRIAKMTRE